MKKYALALLATTVLTGAAHAQSNPGWVTGYVPTAAEWNQWFANKQDVGLPLTFDTLSLTGTAVATLSSNGGAIFGTSDYRRVRLLPQVGDAGSTGSETFQYQRVGSKNTGETFVGQGTWVQTSTTPHAGVLHGHKFTVTQNAGADPGETWALFGGIGTQASTASGNSVAIYGQAVRNALPAAGVGVPIMGAVFESKDLTGASSATSGQQRSLELDLISSGADDYVPANNGRAVITVAVGRTGSPTGTPIGADQVISHLLHIADFDAGLTTFRQGISSGPLKISRSFLETTNITENSGARMIWLADGHKIAFGTTGTSYVSGTSADIAFALGAATNTFRVTSAGGLGTVLTATQGSGGNTRDAANPNTVTIGNQLTVDRLRNTQPTVDLTGATSVGQFTFLSNNFTTSGAQYAQSGTGYAHRFVVASDTANALPSSGGMGILSIAHNVGGSNAAGTQARGTRMPFKVELTQAGAMGAAGTNQHSVGSFWSSWNNTQGGTNTTTNPVGSVYSLYPQILATNGVQNYQLFNVWGEGDISVASGATVKDILGRSTILLATHRQAATRRNIVDLVAAQPASFDGTGATATWRHGYTFGTDDGRWPMHSSSELWTTLYQIANGSDARNAKLNPQLATKALNVGWVNFTKQSGWSLYTPGYSVDGTGQFRSGNLNVTHISTGVSIDTLANRVTAVAPLNAGTGSAGLNNYFPGDIVYAEVTSGVRSQYEITNTKVTSAAVVSGGSGGVNGACTITGTSGTGTKFQATGTVTAGALGGALTVTVPGDYTSNPFDGTTESVTGCSLTGATVSLGIGALTVAVLVPDVSSSTPASITTEGGSGLGLTLTPTWGGRGAISLNVTGGDIITALPTSCAGKAAGTLRNNAGVVNVC